MSEDSTYTTSALVSPLKRSSSTELNMSQDSTSSTSGLVTPVKRSRSRELNMSQDSTSSTSGLVTPQKRSTMQSPSPQVPSPLTKMYSPVPLSSSRDESPVPLSLKGKTKSVEEHVQNAYGETNTLINAALYSVSKNDNKGATTELDKLKRINQCHEQKTLFLISELNKEINNHDQLRRHYQHEKFAAEAKAGEECSN